VQEAPPAGLPGPAPLVRDALALMRKGGLRIDLLRVGEVRGSDYKAYFGKTIPALCCYAKKGGRAPLEVFPRMDKKLGRVYLIEEWLENYIGELERLCPCLFSW
jgi:hypothetical protein